MLVCKQCSFVFEQTSAGLSSSWSVYSATAMLLFTQKQKALVRGDVESSDSQVNATTSSLFT
jgi:hypothetical protein